MSDVNGGESELRINTAISRYALKIATGILGIVAAVGITWASWLSSTLIEMSNERAAHNQVHISLDQRMIVGNERMNLIQKDIQEISDRLSTLRGEYDTIKQQLRGARWSPLESSSEPAPAEPAAP